MVRYPPSTIRRNGANESAAKLGYWLAGTVMGCMLMAPSVALLGQERVAPAGEASRSSSDDHAGAFKYLGSRSCSAVACHGSIERSAHRGVFHNEFVFWMEKDPHASANRTLSNDLSARMLDMLSTDEASRGAELQNCQACHVTRSGDVSARAAGLDGVGCESCHGPAEKWVAVHYRNPWKAMTAEQKYADYGFISGRVPLQRADACAECHVGSAKGEVNHDLIAAGHPPLKFELASYIELLPKHWDIGRQRRANPHHEMELWIAGQYANARQALRLLEARTSAVSEGRSAIWPEFAEYDCFSCHSDLQHPSWRQQRESSMVASRHAILPLNHWYYHFELDPARSVGAFTAAGKPLDELRMAMQTDIVPDPSEVNSAARSARQAFVIDNARIAELAQDVSLLSIARHYHTEPNDGRDRLTAALDSWDQTVQLYLLLVAASMTSQPTGSSDEVPGSAANAIHHRLKDLHRLLKYPAGFDSPRQFRGSILPDDSDMEGSQRKKILDLLRSILQSVPRT